MQLAVDEIRTALHRDGMGSRPLPMLASAPRSADLHGEQLVAPHDDRTDLDDSAIGQCFRGDIEGVGTVEFLLMYPDSSCAFFAGMQRVVGKLNGRSGSFILQTNGTYADGKAGADWFVVPGSATGELRGLHGNGGFSPVAGTSVPIRLDYNFED